MKTMAEKETPASLATDLRRQAEEIAQENVAQSLENIEAMSSEAIRQAFHELQVHQIELEMQNSALHLRQEELDAARARYFDLYELAPVGYITVSKQGLIIEDNLTAATMLGVDRGVRGLAQPIFSQFIHIEDQDIYYRFRKQLLETGERQACELRMVKKDGPVFWAQLEATVAQGPANDSFRQCRAETGQADEPVIRVVMSDIAAEHRLKEANLLLESSRYAESIVETVREPLLVLDADLKIISANRSFYRSFQVAPAETIGSFIYDLGNGQWNIPSLRELLETILPKKTTFDDYEVEHDFTTIGKRTMLLNARQIQRVLGKERIILLAIEDITELKLKEANNLLEQMVEERTKQLRRESEAPPAEGADTILLVDDDPHVLSALTSTLRNTAYEVLTADGGIQALEIMETTKIKVIVS
ncbi:MAG: PAS domain-containing protein, partial [Deltaproteobacteria bacterium]